MVAFTTGSTPHLIIEGLSHLTKVNGSQGWAQVDSGKSDRMRLYGIECGYWHVILSSRDCPCGIAMSKEDGNDPPVSLDNRENEGDDTLLVGDPQNLSEKGADGEELSEAGPLRH